MLLCTGLLEGQEAERQELEEALANSEVGRHDLAMELSAIQERLEALEGEHKSLQEEREQIEQQKGLIAEKLGADDLGNDTLLWYDSKIFCICS